MSTTGTSPATERLPKKKRGGWRVVWITALIIILLIGIVTGVAYWIARSSLPVIEGKLELEGLQQTVSVWRDVNGVPHIEARNEHDLYVAQGYVTAQDRLFQMDMMRRTASGQLSEVMGEQTLERDKFFRAFSLRRAAEASLDAYSADAKNVLEWYAQGVNQYIHQAKASGSLPVEFRLLGYKPNDWELVDSLVIGKYMAYDLGRHWARQAFRYQLAQRVSPEMALELFPSYPEGGPLIIQAMKDHPIDLRAMFAAAVIPDPSSGSNNWVISGKKSASGKPMLANDPHLKLGTPSIWYETHLQAEDLNVSGVVFAGIPGIILGHNQHLAWGVTNLNPDVQDLYIEKRNPDNPNEFEYMGKWEPAKLYNEEIKVKGKPAVSYQVAVTRHGPIISEFAEDNRQDLALALRWTALEPTKELEAFQRFGKTRNWEEFKEALSYFEAPAQNFVFASNDGTIAYRANGKIPIRSSGNSQVPVPGWTGEYEWTGYIPREELPTSVNPSKGYIATANNKVIDDKYPYYITNSWSEPYRAARIQQVLESKEILEVEDLKKLQFDRRNLLAEEFLERLLAALRKNDSLRPIDQNAADLLQAWNKDDDAEQGAPLIFSFWIRQLEDVIFKPEVTDDLMELFENKANVRNSLLQKAIAGKPAPWIDDKGGFQKVAMRSFQLAVDQAVSLQGSDPEKWQWGRFHQIKFAHPLSTVKPLGLLFNAKAVSMGGSKVTVGMAEWDAKTGEVNLGGAWRTVIDLADPLKSFNIVGPGQSGQLLSPWYHDQVEAWTTGKYHETSMVPSIYREAGYHLELVPAAGKH
ncbi:penicillin acylase family protein [Paenibacillus larvae subsp. pulvifaciens]|uniref:Penicillin acylase family protein n=1 Tax=Paenibacillus larvae subsp. pulvifaciens TaxID=1477 RepID=A0A1V0UZD9_9BACL|nr:penicillin acylase family protein [Paenibacillus larvae]ARF70270.1 penicillin acylase family protein [Paenibacillus larvae subsp. pulvifaciens]